MSNNKTQRIEAMLHAILKSPRMMDFCAEAGMSREGAVLDQLRKGNPALPPIAARGFAMCVEVVSLAKLLVTMVDATAGGSDPIAEALRNFVGPKQ